MRHRGASLRLTLATPKGRPTVQVVRVAAYANDDRANTGRTLQVEYASRRAVKTYYQPFQAYYCGLSGADNYGRHCAGLATFHLSCIHYPQQNAYIRINVVGTAINLQSIVCQLILRRAVDSRGGGHNNHIASACGMKEEPECWRIDSHIRGIIMLGLLFESNKHSRL